jgi:hypothetical protein
MQLAEFRGQAAPVLGLSDGTIRLRQQELYRIPELREGGMKGRAYAHTDSDLAATPTNTGMLLLVGILPGPLRTIGERTARMWFAPAVAPSAGCPVTGAVTLGQALEWLLASPEHAAALDELVLVAKLDEVTLRWCDKLKTLPSIFAANPGREYRRRVAAALTGGPIHSIKLVGKNVHKVALLLADDG